MNAHAERHPPIVDTHVHLWDLARVTLQWHANPGFEPLARNWLPDDYAQATAGCGVDKTIYMEVDALPSQQMAEAQFALDLCTAPNSAMAGVVIAGRPDSPEFTRYLDRFRDRTELKGMREVLDEDRTPPGHCLRDEYVAGIRLLGERGLRFDLALRAAELIDGARLAALCPQTRFVLDHCGGARVGTTDLAAWRRGLDALAARPNVVCKVSGLLSSPTLVDWRDAELAPIVNQCWDAFGPERVMFASDWPVCTLAGGFSAWVDALRRILAERPLGQREGFFHENAMRFYELERPTG